MSEVDVEMSESIRKRVEQVWAVVFRSSNQVLVEARIYGFGGLGELPSPNIHDMVRLLKILGAMIDVLYADDDQPYEQQRQLLNAKAQITNMERLASALIAKREDHYEAALQALENQAVM